MSEFEERDPPDSSARVLDPCSGSRMMWFNREHPEAVFGDRRSETVTVTDRSHGRLNGTRTLRVCPDMLMDFRAMPFKDDTFRLVAFDPPHLVRAWPRPWPHRFDKARKKAGVQFNLRQIRAKAGTDKAEAEGLEAAQAQLGHASITTTEIYVRNRRGKPTGPTR